MAHVTGDTVFIGPERFTPARLAEWNNLKPELFGTTTVTVQGPNGLVPHTVGDMRYTVDGGKPGVRLVAVKDSDAAANAAMDALIRKEAGLGPNDELFTLITYIHPEEHTKSLMEAGSSLLGEMNSTHMGAYRGAGRTTNSPENYHGFSWRVEGYPANVQLMTMDGVDNATFFKNLSQVDTVLNKGVLFPSDYKNDPFLTTDLNTTFMFFRDWVFEKPYLASNEWNTYCAEHKTIVSNIGANLPNNEAAFKKVYGDVEGALLFAAYKKKFKEITGGELVETNFTPLWEKTGLTAAQVRPWKDVEEYKAYQKARFDGSLKAGTYTGFKPAASGEGMVWRPETTADLVKNFVETYASFRDVGALASSAAIMGFKDVVKDRMGITDETFMANAAPILTKLLVAEAMARAPAEPAKFQEWAKMTTGGLYVAFGGNVADLAPGGTPKPQLLGLAQQLMTAAMADQRTIMGGFAVPAGKRNDAAYAWLRGAIKEDLQRAREVMVTDPSKTQMYSPPAVVNRVINGMVETNPHVHFRTIATAVDANDTVSGQAASTPATPTTP